MTYICTGLSSARTDRCDFTTSTEAAALDHFEEHDHDVVNGANDLPEDHPRVVAYRALYSAAEKMGALNYRSQMAAHVKARRSKRTFRFVVTEAHDTIVKAMPKVLGGDLTPERAMGLLWGYDVMKERGLKP